MKTKAAALAADGVFIGTSGWKYDGWFGQLYTPARYEFFVLLFSQEYFTTHSV